MFHQVLWNLRFWKLVYKYYYIVMTIFSKIIAGEIPCYKVAENDDFFAFLDIRPLNAGHTLVVPKKEIDYLFDLDDTTLSMMIVFAKKVSVAIQKSIECNRVGLTVIGLEVPHAHIHLIPINTESDMSFHKKRPEISPDEMKTIADKIQQNFHL